MSFLFKNIQNFKIFKSGFQIVNFSAILNNKTGLGIKEDYEFNEFVFVCC